MTSLLAAPTDLALTLRFEPAVRLSEDQLFDFCSQNPELRIERTVEGELIVMSPVGGETSDRNAEIIMQLRLWAKRHGGGRAFDSSAGFLLPSGAMRSPDAAWVESERLRELSPGERTRFLPFAPTFVLELRSPSDPLSGLQAKMAEYLDAGSRLGWLIDPGREEVHVYRTAHDIEILARPARLAADPELPGFVLDLTEIWSPSW